MSPATSTALPLLAMMLALQGPVHARDADRGQQRANGRRNEADDQGDQRWDVGAEAPERVREPQIARHMTSALVAIGQSGHDHDEEDEREGGQHQGERDLVRRALADARPRRARSSCRETIRPAPAEIRTMILSESTTVPPVTPERSPPDSRMTGADSPVIADSLTTRRPR